MNAVEIEEAVSKLAAEPFDAGEFPFAFLAAFGNKDMTIKRLRSGSNNKSDVGGVLQRLNIHLAVAEPGQTVETLARLRGSPQTAKAKAKFILATDGEQVEAEELGSGEVMSCRLATSATTSASSCRWPGSRPSPRSRTTPSTSRRRGGSTASTSSS